ncbi:MAG: agmatinase [Lentisphaerae bacterium]|nr:agmatinase [Lentisphaerota bacterium]
MSATQHGAGGAFLDLPAELSARDAAGGWVLPVPYEATTSYGTGTRRGPAAILAASAQVEWFDREDGGEPAARFGIHTLAPLDPPGKTPEAAVAAVETAVAALLADAHAPRVLAVLGGEHALSVGVVRGLARAGRAPDIIVQLDAHADLRAAYEGSPYSHACTARRLLDTAPLIQLGIRSLSREEDRFRRDNPAVTTVFADEMRDASAHLDALAARVRGRTVYLTVDLDALDPAEMPAVGTPEPGGLSWTGLLAVVRTVCREAAAVPAFDVVELSPRPGWPASDFLAARLVYKTLALAHG